MENKIEIYQGSDGQTQIEVRFEGDTFWLPLQQISELFQRDKSVISRHIKNIYKEGELIREATVAKNATVQMEGKRKVEREVEFYNLDLILSVGYRVNSKQGTQFRIWATKRLKDYLIQGYTINENRLAQKQQEVQTLKDGIRILSRAIQQKEEDQNLDFEWLNHFAKGLELLDDYDHENLDKKGLSKRKAIFPELSDYQEVIKSMRSDFESGVFGKEKDGSFESAIAQISKGFGREDFYPTLEEKAATLLYLIVKNHGFVDGNKRIGAACFLLFLKANDLLNNKKGISIISNDALASLTLFIASSKPEEMDTVKKLVISVLNRNRN
ncbi:RhuM family protein [Cyclobacterium qasimii]|uniref:Death-on-curing protein n=3 Tax=Cyclobacterium qasimii TaxID=1350429 RepID=A0A512C7F7_9BACT|nr:RhuM family protein [Cyclobacterium qasimii]EPR65636.1 putative DNA-binding protein in cluster with Type I restriction-modification system [Cyclobacterium qasimii M12-11B]GEO20158.1 death-on-curing protein [Cyclobacterium qasimii]